MLTRGTRLNRINGPKRTNLETCRLFLRPLCAGHQKFKDNCLNTTFLSVSLHAAVLLQAGKHTSPLRGSLQRSVTAAREQAGGARLDNGPLYEAHRGAEQHHPAPEDRVGGESGFLCMFVFAGRADGTESHCDDCYSGRTRK